MESVNSFSVRSLTAFLVVLFGTGSWVAINGIWVELPLFVTLGIPEGYALASWLIIIIQLANIGPFVFTLASVFAKGKVKLEVPTVYLITTIGWISCLLLIFYWDATTVWKDGDTHSTALLTLCFFLAVVDCTSSVAFTPFMARFRNIYLTWYFIGEGMSSLLPGLLALAQGVGGDPTCVADNSTDITNSSGSYRCTVWVSYQEPARFGPESFFIFLTVMMFCCFVAFLLLNVLPVVKTQHAKDTETPKKRSESFNMIEKENGKGGDETEDEDEENNKKRRPFAQLVYLFLVLGVVNALSNGILPSIQSYSAGAYSAQTYLFAATLGNIANPIACFVVMFKPFEKLSVVSATTVAGMIAGAYCLMTAATSPAPPLQDEVIGKILVVMAWIFVVGFFTYTKATIGWILRKEPNNRTLLIWFGGITQVGSLLGAVIMFPIVNFTDAFVGYYYDPCEDKVACEPLPIGS